MGAQQTLLLVLRSLLRIGTVNLLQVCVWSAQRGWPKVACRTQARARATHTHFVCRAPSTSSSFLCCRRGRLCAPRLSVRSHTVGVVLSVGWCVCRCVAKSVCALFFRAHRAPMVNASRGGWCVCRLSRLHSNQYHNIAPISRATEVIYCET